MNPRKAGCLLAFLIAFVPLSLAQGTYTQIDVPGAVQTLPYGINTAGDIVGSYTDASNNYHGFLLSGGTYTTIDYPGAASTYIYGINDLGQIVGGETSGGLGLLYDIATQTFTTFTYPGATSTTPISINNAGIIVGDMYYHGWIRGFEIAGSKSRVIGLPGKSASSARGVSTSGKIVGFFAGPVDFVFSGGRYKQLQIPNAPIAQVNGVNPAGTALVGAYSPNNTDGFIYQNKILTTLQFPGSSQTAAGGINATGEVSGVFFNGTGIAHGFTWTPPGDAAKK